MWDDGIHEQLVQQQRQQEEQRMQAVVEEAFEVQTYQPFHGWVYDRFCDRSGNTFPALSVAAEDVDGNNKLNVLSEHEDESWEIGVLPNAEWMWSHPWQPDMEYTHCDEEGWSYGSTIARINRRLAEGTSKTKREYYHFVRRRRWIRMRVKKPAVSQDGTHTAVDDKMGDMQSYDEASGGELVPTTPSTVASSHRYYRVYRDSLFVHFRLSGPSSNLSHFKKVVFTDEDVLQEGWLGQRGSLSRSWKLRYFILRRDTSTLVCLRDRASLVALSEIGIDRHTTTMPEKSPNPNQFQFLVINDHHKLRLNAVDERSREKWLSALSELIVRKRASFLAAEDSDSVHNGMNSVRNATSNIFRKMRSSLSNDDGYAPWMPQSAFALPPSASQSDLSEKKSKRRVWRPYKLVASTMYSKTAMDAAGKRDYLKGFQEEFSALLETTRDFLEDNINILEDNLRIAEQVLGAAVARVPQEELQLLRTDVNTSIIALNGRLELLMNSKHANVLHCNMLRKELYTEVRRLNEKTLSFAPPAGQATVKKVAPESPSKRRIPTDWFMGPTNEKADRTAFRHSLPVSARAFDISTTDSSGSIGPPSVQRKRFSTTSLDSHSTSFLTTPTSAVLLTTTFAGMSEPVSIRAFLPYPKALCEGHMELPDGVNGYVFLVHEYDLGSLISFTLCSKAYVEAVESHFNNSIDLAQELKAEEFSTPSSISVKSLSQSISSSTELLYLNKLRSADVQHTEVKFMYHSLDTKHEFRCVTFFASQFHALRALSGHGNVDFLCSLAQSKRWEASGGKSGAFFSMTHDKRYVLKGIPVSEFNMFLHMAPHYFKFMSKIVKTQTPTVITKILGLYKLTHSKRLHKHTTYIVVMENISYGFPPGQTYDIKGITRRRFTGPDNEDRDSPTDEAPRRMIHDLPVLLDGNLIERIPIPVRKADLDVVESAFQNDTGFLSRAGVIDYSLIMIFDEENRQVVVGLIDYLHQFDFLKKMESTSKASLTFRNPTIISPSSYRTRFVNALHRYLVGIELELELRIRKRNDACAKKKASSSSSVPVVTNGKASDDHGRSNRSHSIPTVPRWKVKRSTSDGGFGSEMAYDREAAQAHSDGEDYSSVSSDETCLRESPAMICAFMPEEDNR